MPFPTLSDTESWDWLIRTQNRWPKERPSLYVRHYLAMHRIKRHREAAALLAIVAHAILVTSLRHCRNKGIDINPVDIAETVKNELLHSLSIPKSSGRRGLQEFFWRTVTRKTESVALRPIFKTHQFLQLDTPQAQDQPDMGALAAIESGLIGEQARQILTGAKGQGFDEALRPEAPESGLTAAERYALTRRETAAKRALLQILELAERTPGPIRQKPPLTAKPTEPLAPPSAPHESLRRVAAAFLLEDGEGELPPDWEQQAHRLLQVAERLRIFNKYVHLYQPAPPIAEQNEFDEFDAMHASERYRPFNDFYEWYEEEDELDDNDETSNAASWQRRRHHSRR